MNVPLSQHEQCRKHKMLGSVSRCMYLLYTWKWDQATNTAEGYLVMDQHST